MAELTLKNNNLYQNGRIIVFDNGEQELERDVLLFPGDEKDTYYTVIEGDDLTKIAYDQYKDFAEDAGKYWWIIADANEIENPLDISDLVGQEIVIPSFEKFSLRED